MLAAELIAGALAVGTAPGQATDPPLIVGDHRSVILDNRGGPRGEALLARVAANISDAVDAVEAFWGTDWPRRIEVTATGSERQFADLAGGGAGAGDVAQWSDVAAVAVADRVEPARRLAAGQRVVFAPAAATMSTSALRIVLTHELFHYATRADTAIDAPRWLTEGVGDFVARPAPDAGVPAAPAALPSDADLDAPGPRRAQAYDRAWEFARFVAARFGPDALRRLYLAACGPGHGDVATAVHRILGSPLSEVLSDWRRAQAALRRPAG